MHRKTRALDISKAVKERVWERDGGCCILCGVPYSMPNAHYIPRSHNGLGVERNVVTLCAECHHKFDNTPERPYLKIAIRDYLQSQYEDWNEADLVYKKYQ